MATGTFLIYGANGYTGRLIAQLAAERGARPILAGRNRAEIAALAQAHGCAWRAFALDDTAALDDALTQADLVINCAGPFAHTARLMVDGCLRTRTHYLDITGEVEVFEDLARRDTQARAAGIMLLPGAGFDVVPSDCLAAHLHRQLPGAQQLTLAFQLRGGVSRGTATTAVENLHRAGMVRRAGALVSAPPATREIDFGAGLVTALRIPWGDISTAFHSTGIPNIEVYAALPGSARALTALGPRLGWLTKASLLQRALKWLIRRQPPGPGDDERARGQALLWGEAVDAAGQRRTARLRTPEAYSLTALTALGIADKALAGQAPVGFQTPARAYGADLILGFPGVTRQDC